MGTYCELYVADYPIVSSKSEASPIIMTLFRERDKRVFDRKRVERNQIEWGHADWDPTEVERVVEYTVSVREARDRLRVMGFTLSRAMTEFECEKAKRLDDIREQNENRASLRHLWDEEIALLERSTFSDFLEAFREIVTSGVSPTHFSKRKPDASKIVVYILKGDLYGNFPCQDIRSFFRALFEAVPESAMVTQDLTDLVIGGYYDEADDVCEISLEELKGDY